MEIDRCGLPGFVWKLLIVNDFTLPGRAGLGGTPSSPVHGKTVRGGAPYEDLTACGRAHRWNMRFGITAKLFLGLLATSVLVAVAMGVAMHVSFVRGFLGYLNHQELQRVERLIPTFAEAYRENGDWEFLRGERRTWFQLLRSVEPPPPADGGRAEAALTGLDLRLGLLDAQRRRVAGAPATVIEDATLRPVEVDGQVVGYMPCCRSSRPVPPPRWSSSSARSNPSGSSADCRCCWRRWWRWRWRVCCWRR